MSTTTTVRPRLPLNTFGIAFGTAGLAGTWTAASVELGAPSVVGDALWVAAAVAWVVTLVRYLRRPGGVRAVLADLRHPVLGPFAALVPAVGSLLAAHLEPTAPTIAAIGVWTMLVPTTLFGAWFLTSLLTAPRDPATIHGGYLLPTVAASLLGAQSLATIGVPTLALAYFAAGILFWLLISAVVLARLATGPAIPAPLLPTLAIVSAPPAVAGNAWWAITGGGPSVVHTVLAGTMVALLLPHLFLVRRYVTTGFAIGFWAMTFTTAASATYAVRLIVSSGTGTTGLVLAWVVVAVATALVGSVAVRSLGLLRRAEGSAPRRSTRTYRRLALAGIVTASVAVAAGAGAASPADRHRHLPAPRRREGPRRRQQPRQDRPRALTPRPPHPRPTLTEGHPVSTTNNTETVVAFYTRAFNDGEPEAAAATALGDHYVQHNPGAPDGAPAFIAYVHSMRERFPDLHLDVKRTVSEGDLVVTHSAFHLTPGDRGMAVADVWRLEGGKIVEHWDVMQQVPEQAANANTMF